MTSGWLVIRPPLRHCHEIDWSAWMEARASFFRRQAQNLRRIRSNCACSLLWFADREGETPTLLRDFNIPKLDYYGSASTGADREMVRQRPVQLCQGSDAIVCPTLPP